MKVPKKRFLIFVLTFLITIILDYLFFVGIFSQIPVEKMTWLFDNFILSITLLFWLFLGIPSLLSYYLAFKLNKLNKKDEVEQKKIVSEKSQIQFAVFVTAVFGILLLIFFSKVMRPKFAPYTLHGIQPGELVEPTLMPTVAPVELLTPTLTKTIFLTPTPTPTLILTPTLVPTSTSSPTPTPRVPNPPIINISYPSEMQTIEMGPDQNLCVVDEPVGGDTSGTVQRRHNINDSSWSSYVDIFTLCFKPIEGLNRFSLQYKNSWGDESVIYTRQFSFHHL